MPMKTAKERIIKMRNKNAYEVLGVSPNASDDEIKQAYKELVRKYHPDRYQDNPLSDVAEEKMAEVNSAYDEIMASRRNGGYSYGQSSNGTYQAGEPFDNLRIRSLIQAGNLTVAYDELDNIPVSGRNAEWYFLKGSVCYKRGWANEAYANFGQAVQLDPSNREYAAAYNQMNMSSMGNMSGNPYVSNNRSAPADACNCCSNLICADCCCECMGGDLIPCC